MNKFKLWLFRFFATATAAAMVVGFVRVWWTARVGNLIDHPEGTYWVHIFAWGLRKKAETADVAGIDGIIGDTTLTYQTILAWAFLAACVVLLLASAWLKGRKWSVLPLIAGAAFTAYAWATVYVVIVHRAVNEYGVKLSGMVDRGDPLSPYESQMSVLVYTDIRFGWYLALGAGIFCLILALVRFLLIHNTRTDSEISG
jgi:hypothetical protein